MSEKKDAESKNPLAVNDLTLAASSKRQSSDRIRQAVMKSGGEPFLAPFEVGVSTLTEKIVKFFKQMSFFGFETLEHLKQNNRRNKFTRHGSAPFRGQYRKDASNKGS